MVLKMELKYVFYKWFKAMVLANGRRKRVSGLISLSESRGTDLIPLQRAILS